MARRDLRRRMGLPWGGRDTLRSRRRGSAGGELLGALAPEPRSGHRRADALQLRSILQGREGCVALLPPISRARGEGGRGCVHGVAVARADACSDGGLGRVIPLAAQLQGARRNRGVHVPQRGPLSLPVSSFATGYASARLVLWIHLSLAANSTLPCHFGPGTFVDDQNKDRGTLAQLLAHYQQQREGMAAILGTCLGPA